MKREHILEGGPFPYVEIGEAIPQAAFLTDRGGKDRYVLTPVDPEKADPGEWQATINLVNTAPALATMLRNLLEEVKKLADCVDLSTLAHYSEDDYASLGETESLARSVLAEAGPYGELREEGRPPQPYPFL